MKPKDIPLGALIDTLNDTREKRRKLAEEDKQLVSQYASIEEQIKARLTAEGMDKATGKKATASLKSVTIGNVKDWAKVESYIKKTGNFQLFQRRISDPAFRELIALKGGASEAAQKKFAESIGIEPFDKMNLNLSSLKDS